MRMDMEWVGVRYGRVVNSIGYQVPLRVDEFLCWWTTLSLIQTVLGFSGLLFKREDVMEMPEEL